MASNGLSSLLWFIAIIAMIPLALWLLKRTPMGGATSNGVLRSVAALQLSANQRIVTVEVGLGEERRWLVLGVTAQTITTLHTLTPPSDTTAGAPGSAPPASPGTASSTTSFNAPFATPFAQQLTQQLAQRLARLRGGKGAADER